MDHSGRVAPLDEVGRNAAVTAAGGPRHHLTASCALSVQRLDAAVAFNFSHFCAELTYNLLLNFSLPLVLARHGVAGARHRSFMPEAALLRAFVTQVLQLCLFAAAAGLWIVFDGVRSRVSGFEVAAMALLHFARSVPVAAVACFVTSIHT